MILGTGAGFLEPEFRALGTPLAGRGARTDEYLDAMRAVWAGETRFAGRHVSFDVTEDLTLLAMFGPTSGMR